MTRLVNRTDKRGGPWQLTQAGVELCEEMARGGHTLVSIAKALGVAHTTFQRVRRDDPRAAEAVERGYAAMEDELVHALKQRAMDDTRKDATTAAIFLLKARRGYEIGTNRVPQHLTVVHNDNRTQIALPSAKEMDEYRAARAKLVVDADA